MRFGFTILSMAIVLANFVALVWHTSPNTTRTLQPVEAILHGLSAAFIFFLVLAYWGDKDPR